MRISLSDEQETTQGASAGEIAGIVRSMLERAASDAERMNVTIEWGTLSLNVGRGGLYDYAEPAYSGRGVEVRPLKVSYSVAASRPE